MYITMQNYIIIDTKLPKFICECCDFKCNKKSDWSRHIVRPKHINNEKTHIININTEVKETLQCECGNKYTYTSGLWRHKKKCQYNSNNEDIKDAEENVKITPTMFYDLLKQNNELQKIIINLSSK
jgi:hypothetical protein